MGGTQHFLFLINFADQIDDRIGNTALLIFARGFYDIGKFSSDMSQTGDMDYAFFASNELIADKAVCLKVALESFK